MQSASAVSQYDYSDDSTYDDGYDYYQPTVYWVREGSTNIKGMAEPNMTVHLEVSSHGEKYTMDVNSDSQGIFRFDLPKSLELFDRIEAYVVENGEQVSDSSYYMVFN